jgi:hypothetical protein
MQLKEKKNTMERDKRKLEAELDRQRQTIGKQVFMQVVHQRNNSPHQQQQNTNQAETDTLTAQQSPRTNLNLAKETPRRQWDKTPKALMDLEKETTNSNSLMNAAPAAASNSTSSMSTPSSSASQSPPISNSNNKTKANEPPPQQPNTQNDNSMIMSVDLSKAYYSRDEVIKAIESLKEKYGKETNNINMLLMGNSTQLVNSNNSNTNKQASSVANGNMVKEIEILNGKLSELQNEINRLTLLQQKAPESETQQASHPPAPTAFVVDLNASFNSNNSNANASESSTQPAHHDGSFFISIGNGAPKREKPPTLTPKKNLIYVKSKFSIFENFDQILSLNKC